MLLRFVSAVFSDFLWPCQTFFCTKKQIQLLCCAALTKCRSICWLCSFDMHFADQFKEWHLCQNWSVCLAKSIRKTHSQLQNADQKLRSGLNWSAKLQSQQIDLQNAYIKNCTVSESICKNANQSCRVNKSICTLSTQQLDLLFCTEEGLTRSQEVTKYSANKP